MSVLAVSHNTMMRLPWRFALSVISAVSLRGDMRFSFIAERMDSARFIALLKKLQKDAGKPILVITDNATYYHSNQTQRFIDEQEDNILLAFLPPTPRRSTRTSRCGITPKFTLASARSSTNRT